MRLFLASTRNEWDKLLRRKKYIVFMIIGAALCLLYTGLGQLISGFVSNYGGISLNLTPTPMGALPFFLQFMVPLLMFMGVTDLITVEGSDKTMKAMVFRPVERWKLYASKILAVVVYAGFYLASVFIVCTALNLLFGKPMGFSDYLVSLASYTLTIAPLAILACFAALVALLGRSGTLTMFLLLISYLLLCVLPMFFPVLSEMLFTSYLGWYRLWIGALPAASKLLHMLLILFGYGTVFFTAGSLLFERKEY